MECLPQEVLDQLSALPEDPPADFQCAICGCGASNKFNRSPRDYERPPVCKSCEEITGYSWNGGAMRRTKPTGGSHRDKRNALRIAALSDALVHECNRQKWSAKNGRA